MTKLGIGLGMLAAVVCFLAGAQTINVMSLDQAGAQAVLQAAKEAAEQRNAPSAIAVVDPAGDLLAFQRMNGVRPASADLAMRKHERLRGYSDRPRRWRIVLMLAAEHSSRQHRCTARRHADTRKRRSCGSCWYCWLEQGDRHRDRKHCGGHLEPLTEELMEVLLEEDRSWPAAQILELRASRERVEHGATSCFGIHASAWRVLRRA